MEVDATGNAIRIELPRSSYFTGDVVSGAVVLETTRETSTRGLTLDVLGRESTEIERGSGDDRRTYRSRSDHVAWRVPLAPEGVVAPGVYRYPFEFQIPVDALPSYAGTHAKVEYSVTARFDVPWWPDAVFTLPLFVYFARESIRTFSRPVRFRSGEGGPEIYVELDGDRFFAREILGCRITLLGTGEHRIRRVYVRLVGGERARASSPKSPPPGPRFGSASRSRLSSPFPRKSARAIGARTRITATYYAWGSTSPGRRTSWRRLRSSSSNSGVGCRPNHRREPRRRIQLG